MDWAADYVGLPYRERGRSRETGVDCWGLVALVLRERFGQPVPLYEGAGEEGENAAARRAVAELIETEKDAWTEVRRGEERPGDVLLFRMLGLPIHVGVVVEPGHMLHCERGCNSVLADYRRDTWSRRLLGIYRYEPSAAG